MCNDELLREIIELYKAFQYRGTYLPSILFPSLYSLNNGSTKNGYSENAQFRHSDKATGRNLYAIDSRLSSANGEPFNGQPVTLNHGSSKAQILNRSISG